MTITTVVIRITTGWSAKIWQLLNRTRIVKITSTTLLDKNKIYVLENNYQTLSTYVLLCITVHIVIKIIIIP